MMVNDHSHQPNIEAARELLSPYLDGEVTTEERALVEAALAASGELHEDLATLRQTVALLAELPPVAAPRPFTLTAADVPASTPTSRRIWGLPAWLAGWAMVAASLVCVLAIGGALFTLQFQGGSPAAEIARLEDSAVQQAAAPQPEFLATTEEAATQAEAEAELAPAEPAAEEKMLLAESAEAPAAATEAPAQKEAGVAEEPQALAADETTEEMVSMAGESEEVTEGQLQLESAAESAPVEREAAGAAPAPTPTPSPKPAIAALEAPAATQPAAPAESPAEEAPAPLAEPDHAPPPAAAEAQQPEPDLAAPAEAPQLSQDDFLATAEPQPTATFTPTPTPPVVAQVTPLPAPAPPSPTPATSPDQTASSLSRNWRILVAGLFVLGGLVLLGLAIRLRRQKQQN